MTPSGFPIGKINQSTSYLNKIKVTEENDIFSYIIIPLLSIHKQKNLQFLKDVVLIK